MSYWLWTSKNGEVWAFGFRRRGLIAIHTLLYVEIMTALT